MAQISKRSLGLVAFFLVLAAAVCTVLQGPLSLRRSTVLSRAASAGSLCRGVDATNALLRKNAHSERLGQHVRGGVLLDSKGDRDERLKKREATASAFSGGDSKRHEGMHETNPSSQKRTLRLLQDLWHRARRQTVSKQQKGADAQTVPNGVLGSLDRQRRILSTAMGVSAQETGSHGDQHSPGKSLQSPTNLDLPRNAEQNGQLKGTHDNPISIRSPKDINQYNQNPLPGMLGQLNQDSPSETLDLFNKQTPFGHFSHPLSHVHTPHFRSGAPGLFSPQGHVTTTGRPVVTLAYLHSLLERDVRRWEAITSGESPMTSSLKGRRMQAEATASEGTETVELALGGGIEAIG